MNFKLSRFQLKSVTSAILEMAMIGDLPPKILCKIFDHLELNELVEKKLVTKLWNELISSQIKVRQLVVENGTYAGKIPWYHTRLPAKQVGHPILFVSQLHRPILSLLKRLRLEVADNLTDFNLNELNVFRHLVQLEVDHLIAWPDAQIEWNFPNLEILKFARFGSQSDRKTIVDCPELKVLFWRCEKDDAIEIKVPETIRILETRYVSRLSQFKNVQTYRFNGELKFVDVALIEQLPNLQALHLYGALNSLYYDLEDIEAMKQSLRQLLIYRRKARLLNLKLFFIGVEIKDEALVDKLNLRMVQYRVRSQLRLSNELLYFGRYPADCKLNLEDALPFVLDADYNFLMGLLNEQHIQFPDDYFRRFPGIRNVISRGTIREPAHFAYFLSKLTLLGELELLYPSLDQAWFNRLPSICSLGVFTLQENKAIELNFDFLGLFESYLCIFDLDRPLAIVSAGSLPNLLKSFKVTSASRKFRFKFRGQDAQIRMRKVGEDAGQEEGELRFCMELDNDYDVLLHEELKLRRVNSTEVVNYFAELEDKLEENQNL